MPVRPPLPARSSVRADRFAAGLEPELGNEPPIDPAGRERRDERHDRQRVSWRWLAGAVLTGVFGCGLLGAALYLSIEAASVMAEPPVLERTVIRHAADETGALEKGDRLVRNTEVLSARQSFRTPVTLKVGGREVIKDRGFVRVATSLSTIPGKFAAQVPAFNPLKLMNESANAEQFVEPAVETGDADVSLDKSDFAAVTAAVDESRRLAPEDVAAQVSEQRRIIRESDRAAIPLSAQLLLARTLRAPIEAAGALAYAPGAGSDLRLGGFEARVGVGPGASVAVERLNVMVVGKYDDAAQARQPVEKTYLVKRGDTIDRIVKGLGGGAADADAAMNAMPGGRAYAPEEGRMVRVLLGGTADDLSQRVLRVVIVNETRIETGVARDEDSNRFVAVELETGPPAIRRAPPRRPVDDEDEEDDGRGMRLYQAFYETALGQQIPRTVIDELVRLFSNDVDFQRRASADDTFEIFYGDEDGDVDLMYAAITVGGEKYRYYRFTHEDGSSDYYDETGKSAKKFLLRKPLASGIQRSGFGMRYHPILRYSRMHNGVDFADKHGTPIVAAGNGKVISAGWDRGYGRRVEIEHTNGYVTTYSHMAGFARGVEDGARVRQGQVIGFMGSTGLSTGTHLHYEVVVNGTHQDPMRLRVPRSKQFTGREMADFKRHLDQVESLIARAPGGAKLAQAGR